MPEDTATSLGTSLQPHIKDPGDTILPTLVNAIFDRGYYGSIVLSDMQEKVLIERSNPETFKLVPG